MNELLTLIPNPSIISDVMMENEMQKMTFEAAVVFCKEVGYGSLLDGLECIEELIALEQATEDEIDAFRLVTRTMRPLFV